MIPGGRGSGMLKRLVGAPLFRLALWQDQRIVAAQQRNLARFPTARFTSTALDLMRPHTLALAPRWPWWRLLGPETTVVRAVVLHRAGGGA